MNFEGECEEDDEEGEDEDLLLFRGETKYLSSSGVIIEINVPPEGMSNM